MPRLPKSVSEHIANGTYRPSRHDFTPVEMPKVKKVDMPEGMSKASRKAWEKIIPELLKNEMISVVDEPLLEHAFFCHSMAMKAKENIDNDEEDFIEMNKLYRANMEEWKAIMYKFGVSPMERGKIKAPEKPLKDENDVSDILKLQGKM